MDSRPHDEEPRRRASQGGDRDDEEERPVRAASPSLEMMRSLRLAEEEEIDESRFVPIRCMNPRCLPDIPYEYLTSGSPGKAKPKKSVAPEVPHPSTVDPFFHFRNRRGRSESDEEEWDVVLTSTAEPGSKESEWVAVERVVPVKGKTAPPTAVAKTYNKKKRATVPKPKQRPILFNQEAVNPCLMPHVLEIAFSHLPKHDLRNCLLVCRIWNEIASPMLNNRTELIIRTNDSNVFQVDAVKEEIKKNPMLAVGELQIIGFNVTESSWIWQQVTYFQPCLSVFKLSACVIDPLDLNTLLKTALKGVESLHFRSVGFKHPYHLEHWIEKWLKALDNVSLPSVKELSIIDDYKFDYLSLKDIVDVPTHGNLPVPISALMMAFPAVKKLSFKCLPQNQYGRKVNGTVDNQNNWRTTLEEFSIQSLDSGRNDLSIYKFLNTIQYSASNLTKVFLSPCKEQESPLGGFTQVVSTFKRFLNTFRMTLKDVTVFLYCNGYARDDPPLLPLCFPRVEKLAITSSLIGKLNYLDEMPKLTHLTIHEPPSVSYYRHLLGMDMDNANSHPPPKSNPNIIALTVRGGGDFVVGGFGKLFPNTQILDLNFVIGPYSYYIPDVEKIKMEHITESFQNAHSLKVRYATRYNSGMEPEDSDIIGHHGTSWLEKEASSTAPCGLSHMSNLRVVDIHPMRNISDAAVIHGFGQLRNLEFINLSSSNITARSLTWLKDPENLPNLKTLKIEGCKYVRDHMSAALGLLRPSLNIIYSKIDHEVPFCNRWQTEREHDKDVCGCDQFPDQEIDPNLAVLPLPRGWVSDNW